jgi:hypothetical protein
MIAPEAGLSVTRQCALLGIARSSFYYRPRPESAAEVDLLKRLDRIFTNKPKQPLDRKSPIQVRISFPRSAVRNRLAATGGGDSNRRSRGKERRFRVEPHGVWTL